ncbi:hypothetical protein B0H13DRAFT_2046272 [Mycena leptocephala]|nr:hypothetical protein B0H13DRAFT_2046272 [Mycena leptocephala]
MPAILIKKLSTPFARLSIVRIISFTLAGGDVFQTIPRTYAFYKKQWDNRKLSPACFFYAVARYMTIISLISNGIDYNALGFYGKHFTLATCKPFYMLPNITGILHRTNERTYAISGHSKYVWYGLGSVLLLGFPVQVFGITYHRDVRRASDGIDICKGRVNHVNEVRRISGVFCSVLIFEFVFHLSNMPTFFQRVLTQGLVYFIVVFLVNLWVVLEFVGLIHTGAASTLSLAIVLIAIQHLILGTQGSTSNNDTVRLGAPQSSPGDKSRRQSAIVFGAVESGLVIDLQSSVFAKSRMDDSQTSHAQTDKDSNPNKEDVI